MPPTRLLPKEMAIIKPHIKDVYYSDKYMDDLYVYRTVTLCWSSQPPIRFRHKVCQGEEWRALGVVMSPGWLHLGWSPCELSSLTDAMIFRKDIDVDPQGALYKAAQAKGIVLPADATHDEALK